MRVVDHSSYWSRVRENCQVATEFERWCPIVLCGVYGSREVNDALKIERENIELNIEITLAYKKKK